MTYDIAADWITWPETFQHRTLPIEVCRRTGAVWVDYNFVGTATRSGWVRRLMVGSVVTLRQAFESGCEWLARFDRTMDRWLELDAADRARRKQEWTERKQLSPFERAGRWLEKVDPAQCGKCGRGADCPSYLSRWFKTAVAIVRGFDLDDHQAADLMADYNQRCSPPMHPNNMKKRLLDARKRGRMPQGSMNER